VQRSHRVTPPKARETQAAARAVLAELDITETPRDVYRVSERLLDIELDKRTLHVDLERGAVNEEGQRPRFLLRVMNWLHLNRGKKAWTYLADTYAVFLLFLATSGLLMIPGKKGLLGRGAVFAGVGAIVPIVYVVLAGGP
jgi:hypothetical protein